MITRAGWSRENAILGDQRGGKDHEWTNTQHKQQPLPNKYATTFEETKDKPLWQSPQQNVRKLRTAEDGEVDNVLPAGRSAVNSKETNVKSVCIITSTPHSTGTAKQENARILVVRYRRGRLCYIHCSSSRKCKRNKQP